MKKYLVITAIALVSLSGILFVTTSCESNTYEEVAKVTNPTYEDNIGPLMESKCTTCHSVTGLQEPYLTTYDEVKDAVENGVVLCIIDNPEECFYSNIMPPTGRMPQTTIDMVYLWKEQGYAN